MNDFSHTAPKAKIKLTAHHLLYLMALCISSIWFFDMDEVQTLPFVLLFIVLYTYQGWALSKFILKDWNIRKYLAFSIPMYIPIIVLAVFAISTRKQYAIIPFTILHLCVTLILISIQSREKMSTSNASTSHLRSFANYLIHGIGSYIAISILTATIYGTNAPTDETYEVLIYIISTYILVLYLIPVYQKKGWSKRLLGALLIVIILFGISTSLVYGYGASKYLMVSGVFLKPIEYVTFEVLIANTLSFIIPATIAFIYYAIWRYLNKVIDNIQKETESKNIQLNILSSQINPHFLFNALNLVYASAIEEKATHTASITTKLSNMMRYMMKDIKKDYISMRREVEHIEDYIKVHNDRLSPIHEITFKKMGTLDIQIAPGLFLPLVENAFKHGLDVNTASHIDIELHSSERSIVFTISNSIPSNPQSNTNNLGLGLDNVKKRLNLIYPDNHQFTVKENNEQFQVSLVIAPKVDV